METKISKQFQKGLAEYDLSIDDLTKWRYCGGNKGRHLNYFRKCCPNDDKPENKDECICGHAIVENCYITNGPELLIVGNCCINRFLPKENAGRSCEICKKRHKNRKDNLCHDCRKNNGKTCEICRKPHRNIKDNLCNHCRHNNGGICMICGAETMKKSFKKCVKCYYS